MGVKHQSNILCYCIIVSILWCIEGTQGVKVKWREGAALLLPRTCVFFYNEWLSAKKSRGVRQHFKVLWYLVLYKIVA